MRFLLRFGAISGALSGLFIALPGAVEGLVGETAATSLVIGVSPALAVPLVTALYLTQPRTVLGNVGYGVSLVGLGLFGGAAYALNVVLFHLGDPKPAPVSVAVLSGSALVFAVGSALFAVAMLRARVHPRVPAWAYATALPLFTFAARLPDTPLTSALHVVVGATLVWLARSVHVHARSAAYDAAGAASRPAASSSSAISTSAA